MTRIGRTLLAIVVSSNVLAACGGSDGGGGSSTGGTSGCPTDLAGPVLVQVPVPNGAGYCVDATEVTTSQYDAFLASSPAMDGQDAWCAWNTTFVPWAMAGSTCADCPVVGVDWCDAYAYCKWAGKRLCGKIGGGPSDFMDAANAETSQWHNACSAGGTKMYPYGSSYSGTACNGSDNAVGEMVPAGSKQTCEGGHPGLFDLSGNVAEWEDACATTNGSADLCRVRGGSVDYEAPDLACGSSASGNRDFAGAGTGFRCCRG